MPVIYQHNINAGTKLAVWHIIEPEEFFLAKVPAAVGITHWHKRLQHLAGRYLLQELFPGFPYHLIEIATTRKPFLPAEDYHFSISHCGDYAAAMVSKNSRVGIDIEMITQKVLRVKDKFLHPSELEFIPSKIPELTLTWSMKEALFKYYGEGGVDFRENLRLSPFLPMESGSVEAQLLFNETITLQLEYRMLGDFVLAWTAV